MKLFAEGLSLAELSWLGKETQPRGLSPRIATSWGDRHLKTPKIKNGAPRKKLLFEGAGESDQNRQDISGCGTKYEHILQSVLAAREGGDCQWEAWTPSEMSASSRQNLVSSWRVLVENDMN